MDEPKPKYTVGKSPEAAAKVARVFERTSVMTQAQFDAWMDMSDEDYQRWLDGDEVPAKGDAT
jgi:putative SOS response-associated peptidase YedK